MTKQNKTKKQLLRLWNDLKRKYNNTYIDLSVIAELNNKGVGVY